MLPIIKRGEDPVHTGTEKVTEMKYLYKKRANDQHVETVEEIRPIIKLKLWFQK